MSGGGATQVAGLAHTHTQVHLPGTLLTLLAEFVSWCTPSKLRALGTFCFELTTSRALISSD